MYDLVFLEAELLLLVPYSAFHDLTGDLDGDLDDDFRLEVLAEGRRPSLASVFFFGEDDDFPKRLGRTMGEDDEVAGAIMEQRCM